MFYYCYKYSFTHTCVQHDVHARMMFVSLSVTPIKLQELPSLPDHPSVSRFQVTGSASPSGSPEFVPVSRYTNCQPFRITRVCPGFKLQELPSLPDHPSLSRFLVEFMFGNRQLLCVFFCRSLFVHFFLTIVLYVLFRFTAFDFSFGIFKFFLMSSAKSYINGEDA